MVKNRETNGTEEIALVTPTPDIDMFSALLSLKVENTSATGGFLVTSGFPAL